MALFGCKRCERCGKILFFSPGVCPGCGMPVADRSGQGYDVANDIDPALRSCFVKYKNAGYTLNKREGGTIIMSHRNLKSGPVTRTRYLEYVGYFAIAMGTYDIFDGNVTGGVLEIIVGLAIMYYDHAKKLVRISLDSSGAVVEKGNVLKN